MDGADELVLLGDVFDLLFGRVEEAFVAADPFFTMVAERMRGGRVVFVAGNHDHHLVVSAERARIEERVATGVPGSAGPGWDRETNTSLPPARAPNSTPTWSGRGPGRPS